MPAGDNSYPWDVTFTITGGATYGFMLTTPKNQSKQIAFTEAGTGESLRYSALNRLQTQFNEENRDFDPKFDTPFSMNDFTSGCGQLEYDFQDDTAYWWSTGMVTHVPGKVYPAPPTSTLALTGTTGALTGILTYTDSTNTRYDFLWEGTNLWRRDASNNSNAWTKVYTASVTITDFKIMDGIGLIAVPSHATSTIDYYYQSNILAAATWTPVSVDHTPFSNANGKPKFFHVVRGTCYALVDNGKVYYTTDPTANSWLGPIDTTLTNNISGPPGDKTYPWMGVLSVGDFLFVKRKDGIYSIDSQQDVQQVIWQWKSKPSEYNFKYTATGSDLLLYGVGPEIYSYDPQTGVNTRADFARKDGFSVKEILGIAADNQYAYILARVRVPILRSADSVALFRAVRSRSGRWSYEVLWEDSSLTGKTYGMLEAMPFGVGTRLYWGQDNASDTVTYVMDIPAEWDETQSGSFNTSASIWTSMTRAGFAGFQKHLLYYNSNGLNLDSTNKFTTYYSTDGGVSFTSLTANTDAHTEADFTNVNGYTTTLRFDFVGNGTTPPVMQNFDLHERVRFKYLPQAKISVRVAKNIETRSSSKSNLDVWEVWDNIKTLRTSNGEITYKDFLGNSFKVTIDQIDVHPTRHEAPTEYEEEAIITVTRADRGE